MRILVIEDEKKTAAFLAKGLREAGFVVDLAPEGETGLELARATKFDLLIVDIMLPNKDGWQVVAELRRGLPAVLECTISGRTVYRATRNSRQCPADN